MKPNTHTASIEDLIEQEFEEPNHTPWEAEDRVVVRTREGESLDGVAVHGDGISFRTTRPMTGGKVVELVVCSTFLFEAEVVGCAPLPISVGGYLIRARFHEISPAMTDVIRNEINRLMDEAG